MRLAAVTACALLVVACGRQNPTSPDARGAHQDRHHTARAGSRAADTHLTYRPLYRLAAPLQDPASAPLGSDGFALIGGLTAADSSSDQVIVGSLSGSAVKSTLPNAQHDAQAAALAGQVYVFGGGQFTQYDHILAFSPSTHAITLAGTLPTPASDVAVTGDVSTAYIVGGYDGVNWLNTVLAYSPGGSPRVVAHLPVALRYASAAVVNGDVLIAGGSTENGVSDAIYKVDPSSGSVTTLGRLPAGITHAGAGVLNGTMYLVGGRGDLVTDRSAQILAIDPTTGKVSRAGSLPQPLSDLGVISLPTGLVVAGGAASAGTQAGVGELVPAS